MSSLQRSIEKFERGLRQVFKHAVVERDLELKHERMRESAFLFLRATCWRWAECASELCPSLFDAPKVPSIGDAHCGNFGLWRDEQARLVWGFNDFDEAARLPYTLDLVRLCASLLLATKGLGSANVADFVLTRYRERLDDSEPFVLERKHHWLRNMFSAKDHKREKFWQELDDAPPARTGSLDGLEAPLVAAVPHSTNLKLSARSAGAGSLGRPRFVAYDRWYRGGPVAAEIKGRMPSCWASGDLPNLAQQMAHGTRRAPDPTLVYADSYVLRRFAPNARKHDFDEIEDKLQHKLIEAMAEELASVHANDGAVASAISDDLRKRHAHWLARAAKHVAEWTEGEYHAYRRASSS